MLNTHRIMTCSQMGYSAPLHNNWNRNSLPVKVCWIFSPLSIYCTPCCSECCVLSCWHMTVLHSFISHNQRQGKFAPGRNLAWCLWDFHNPTPDQQFYFSMGGCWQTLFCLLHMQQQPRGELMRQPGCLVKFGTDCRPCSDRNPSSPIFYVFFHIVAPMR